jgi:hypothetical protein
MNDSPTRLPAQSAIAAPGQFGSVVATQHDPGTPLGGEAVEFVN